MQSPLPTADEARKPRAFVQPERRDGKFAVLFVYPATDKRLTKIITRERLQEIITEGRYAVSGQPRNMQQEASQ